MKRAIWHLGIGLLVGTVLVTPCVAAWTIGPLNATYVKTANVSGLGDAVGNNSSGTFKFGKNNASGQFAGESADLVTFGTGLNGQTTWECKNLAPPVGTPGGWSVSPTNFKFERTPDHFGQVYDDLDRPRATTSTMKSVITPN